MFYIPGVIIAALTFPGVMIHELAHQLFCRLMGVPVYAVKYFQFDNTCGYVIHEPTESPFASLIISIGPFLVNNLLGILILLPVAAQFDLMSYGQTRDIWFVATILAIWLGLSILIHSFPSEGDARLVVHTILKNKEVALPIRILVAPIVALCYIGAYGSIAWLDIGYALAVAYGLTKLLLLFA